MLPNRIPQAPAVAVASRTRHEDCVIQRCERARQNRCIAAVVRRIDKAGEKNESESSTASNRTAGRALTEQVTPGDRVRTINPSDAPPATRDGIESVSYTHLRAHETGR